METQNESPKVATDKWKALAQDVIAVAQMRYGGRWKCYIGAVPGISHRAEWQKVSENGNLVEKAVADAIFPEFADMPYA